MKMTIAFSCALFALSGCITSDRIAPTTPSATGAYQFSEANTAIPEETAADGAHAVAGSAGLYQPRMGNRPTLMMVPGSGGTFSGGEDHSYAPRAPLSRAYAPQVTSPRYSGTVSASRPDTTPTGLACHTGPRGGRYHITRSGHKSYSGC